MALSATHTKETQRVVEDALQERRRKEAQQKKQQEEREAKEKEKPETGTGTAGAAGRRATGPAVGFTATRGGTEGYSSIRP